MRDRATPNTAALVDSLRRHLMFSNTTITNPAFAADLRELVRLVEYEQCRTAATPPKCARCQDTRRVNIRVAERGTEHDPCPDCQPAPADAVEERCEDLVEDAVREVEEMLGSAPADVCPLCRGARDSPGQHCLNRFHPQFAEALDRGLDEEPADAQSTSESNRDSVTCVDPPPIVGELRDESKEWSPTGPVRSILRRAAEEIERLNESVNDWEDIVHHQATLLVDLDTQRQRAETAEKLHRESDKRCQGMYEAAGKQRQRAERAEGELRRTAEAVGSVSSTFELERTNLRAKATRLEAALRPLAAAARFYENVKVSHRETVGIWTINGSEASQITVGDAFRARAALADTKGE